MLLAHLKNVRKMSLSLDNKGKNPVLRIITSPVIGDGSVITRCNKLISHEKKKFYTKQPTNL